MPPIEMPYPLPLPSIQFRTVVVDPPWTPALGATWDVSDRRQHKGRPQARYSTMSVEEIIAVKPVLAPQSHLYVWCLSQHVDWGYQLARAWGAEPIILWTWRKPGIGVGRFRYNTEHVLVSRVGPRQGNPFGQGGRHAQATNGTCFDWPRGRHSEKPQEFYSLVESLSLGPRLDMYARITRPNWHSWGDQL